MPAWNSAPTEVRIAVAVAHRDPLVRAGLASILGAEPGFDVTVVGDDIATAAGSEVVVADYDTALALCEAPEAHRPAGPRPRVMVVSHRDRESDVRHALKQGVHGYLLLGCGLDEMLFGVRALHRGQHHLASSAAQRVVESLNHQALTTREGDVLRLIAVGHVNKTIATELDISVGTVKAHVKAILAKFGAKTRTEAAAIAQRRGLA